MTSHNRTSESTPVVIASPCINICKINTQSGLCEGCWRTLEEITIWSTADDSTKQVIWQKIHQRIQQQYQHDLSAFDPE